MKGCQACGGEGLREIAGFGELPRVTSDSKPFRPGGRLFVCERCGLTQKSADPQWLAEIGEIYRDYEMYHQSAALDQAVFVDGRPIGRCELLARQLLKFLPDSGRLLDVGAGSGAMLAAFSAMFPRWKLYGLDLDERKRPLLETIPRFEQLFTVPPVELALRFDLVTLIHSLEHFVEPLAMLRALREKIVPGGRLFVEVNNVEATPFDLVVADHLCHFTPRSLAALVSPCGFRLEHSSTDWIRKEISLLLTATSPGSPGFEDPKAAIARVEGEVAWLKAMLEHARAAAAGGRFGIFGTSVAATWLAAGLGDAVEFFIDEDPAREGRQHLGRPILRPEQVPAGAVAYLAFIGEVAAAIRRRLAGVAFRLVAL